MDGWVGHVGWPIADGLTTKWSPIQLAVWRRIGKVCRPRPAFSPLCYAVNSVKVMARIGIMINVSGNIRWYVIHGFIGCCCCWWWWYNKTNIDCWFLVMVRFIAPPFTLRCTRPKITKPSYFLGPLGREKCGSTLSNFLINAGRCKKISTYGRTRSTRPDTESNLVFTTGVDLPV